ncbi:MAG: class II fructose-bisphosphate aldolase [Oscillospiraceae bacterium]|jgi:tagatose 1,6-diphosphate aldolase GatY/KbaY|nr:class II fructose-bisphosphate aldolase [Oscillospiraceae bacterium]
MPLVKLTDMLPGGRWAIPALNVENMEMAQGVVEAAEALRAPVILQTTPGTLKHAPPALFVSMISALARSARVPVGLHLDHGDSLDLVYDALEAGYTSVMFDGSKLSFEENVTATARAVAMAGGVPVEGELGAVGGKEDSHSARAELTDPAQAAEFALRTGAAMLAVAIGTAHGVYAVEPKLDMKRLSAIKAAVSIPLVLHGTSGISAQQVRSCVMRGVRKVNVATELRAAFTQGVRSSLSENENAFDPKIYMGAGRARVRAVAEDWIRVCGAKGKA